MDNVPQITYQQLYESVIFLIPLGVIGAWRWSVWIIKRIASFFYRPYKNSFKAATSVITPVYNEDPKIFKRALDSWKYNSPNEIIAVIDYSDKKNIEVFKKFALTYPAAKLIVTKKPGKRPALVDGIKIATSEIVALVDCDTIWEKDVLKNGLMPFINKKIAGVATRQSVLKAESLAQKLFSIRLEQRYWDDVPFLSLVGGRLQCLSGRTAFYRRKTILPLLNDLENEFFFGKRVISGEDKRLTYLVQAHKHKTYYQESARVYTTGAKEMSTYFQQQTRWIRNSWRADLRALKDGWPFRYPIFALYLIDRAIQPFTLILSPMYFIASIVLGLWPAVYTIIVWWLLSRTIKMFPHLQKYPLDILLLPSFIIFNFVTAYLKIYALFSLNTQGWITRWDKSRLPTFTLFQKAAPQVATFVLVGALFFTIFSAQSYEYYTPRNYQAKLAAKAFVQEPPAYLASNQNVLGAASEESKKDLMVKRYIIQPGDTISGIAYKFGVPEDKLIYANAGRLTVSYYQQGAVPGIVLSIPPKDLEFNPNFDFLYNINKNEPQFLTFNNFGEDNGIEVHGRNQVVTLATLRDNLGTEVIEEVKPNVWLLKRSLNFMEGTMFVLDESEVTWLQMQSTDDSVVSLKGFSTTFVMNGVKITSWDTNRKDYDTKLENGRSYILVKDAARMDIYNSELAYLGYPRPLDGKYSTYGVSWRMTSSRRLTTLISGEILGSKFHNNYFGAYTFGATGMLWRGNDFYENTRYGLDPHDDSNGFLVEFNRSHHNGTHGIIFSKRCLYNTIRNNISYENKLHGIMLHEDSNYNVIENNNIYGNKDGISLHGSDNNVVRNNTVNGNKNGILSYRKSVKNVMVNNIITNNARAGINLYEESGENIIEKNTLSDNISGMYIKTSNNQITNNTFTKNDFGVYLLNNSKDNYIVANEIANVTYGVYSKVPTGIPNVVRENMFAWNKADKFIREQ